MFGLPSLSFGPSLLPDLGSVFKAPVPVKSSLPKTVSIPKGVKVADIGSGASGAAGGAIAGSTFGPVGTGVGAAIGGIAGLFGKPSGGSSGMPTLSSALGAGLGSLGFTSNTQTNTQVQNVDQSTGVNITNVLGGRTFGGADLTTGDFDIFRTITDVFAIRDAQASAVTSGAIVSAAGQAATEEKSKVLPLVLLAGGGILVLYLLTGKGK